MTQPAWGAGAPDGSTAATPLPWARQGATTQERVTTRVRRMVEGLPSWEPLPPGEIVVHRPSL